MHEKWHEMFIVPFSMLKRCIDRSCDNAFRETLNIPAYNCRQMGLQP